MKVVRLGDVCEVSAGQSPVGSSYNESGTGVEFHQGKKLFGADLLKRSLTFTSQPNKIAESGDILISVRAPVGPINNLDRRICIGRGLAAIRPNEKIDKDYLFYFLRLNEENINGRQGATFASISKTEIESIPLSLPLLEEQRRVVERLDVAFEKIDRAIGLTEKNIKNADAIFGSLLDTAVQRNPDVEDRTIGEIANIEYGLTEKSKSKGDYRLIRITDINSEGFLGSDNKVYVSANQNSEKYLLREGDIVVARTGATFGKVLHFDDSENAVFASYLIRINFNGEVLPKLFWYFAKTPQYWRQANTLASGAAQPQFNGGALKQVKFSYPASRDEQQVIVERLDAYHRLTLKLKVMYQKKIDELSALKQALLTQAFSQSEVE